MQPVTSSTNLGSKSEFFNSASNSKVFSSKMFQVISDSNCPAILKKFVLAASNYVFANRINTTGLLKLPGYQVFLSALLI